MVAKVAISSYLVYWENCLAENRNDRKIDDHFEHGRYRMENG